MRYGQLGRNTLEPVCCKGLNAANPQPRTFISTSVSFGEQKNRLAAWGRNRGLLWAMAARRIAARRKSWLGLLGRRNAAIALALALMPAAGVARQQKDDRETETTDCRSPIFRSEIQNDPGKESLPDNPVPKVDQARAPKQKEKEQSQAKQTKRMFWVVPNFGAVNADTQLPAMSTRQKFALAAHDSLIDYSSFTWAGVLAGQAWLLNSDPELGHGAAAYGRYYWRNFTDGVSGAFFTEAIVPAMTHEDPRYYTLGQGGFLRRTEYAVAHAFVGKTDAGTTRFNWSEVGGNGLEAALSNAYYPPQERGFRQTVQNWGVQMESAVLNHIFQEFWPDIRKDVFRRK